MVEQWEKWEEISKENVIKRINLLRKNSNTSPIQQGSLEEEYEFVGKHFEELKNEISQLEIDEIIRILKHPGLIIETEDTLWEIIKQKIEEYPAKRNELLSCVNFEYMDLQYTKPFVRLKNPER